MINAGKYFLFAAVSLLIVVLSGCQPSNTDKTALVEPKSTETASRTVVDGGTGPFKALMASDGSLTTHTIFRPKDLSVFGKKNKLPVIAWGNGACANSPWEHINFLSEIASYGFLVIAIGTMPAEGQRGAGGGGMGRGGARGAAPGGSSSAANSQLIDAINWAVAQDSNKASIYYNKIDIKKIAAAGMSCGGFQAYEAAPDPRVTTVMICNSGIYNTTGEGGTRRGMGGMPSLTKEQLKKLHTPIIFILGGQSDMAYPNGMDDFSRISNLPAFAANLDVGHSGTYSRPHGGEFAIVATAWLQWQLKDDKEAAKMFTGNPCGLAQDERWKVEKKNIP